MSYMSTKYLKPLEDFYVKQRNNKGLLVVGSLSKSDKHFQLIFWNFLQLCMQM